MKMLSVVLCLTLIGCVAAPKSKIAPATPHVFYAGVATYIDKHPVGLFVSKDRFLSCREALDDTQSALAKIGEDGDGSHSGVGVCIPVPVFDPADMIPVQP